MNHPPWYEASTILCIKVKYTMKERILPKKKSKVIQVFVFVLDLLKETGEELNIWSKAQIKKYQLKVIQWQKIKHTTVNQELNQGEQQNGATLDNSLCRIQSNYRIQLQYDSIQYY
ncbi:Hypothetical_protein [Hexamita inflata]|uniref:Hypothetical_protein n=1 Tax=Hexamita inflata TaxID=28002 RepID=A0AA86RHA9_9EUKA|nr:Hypothetical protein HINF_LOCUS61946 [Hexamita inflata]